MGLVMALIATLSACSSYRYYTSGADDISLSKYKSFAFAQRLTPRTPDSNYSDKRGLGARLNYVNNNRYYNNPEAMQKIQAATVNAMQSKGFVKQEGNADLIVRYHTLVDRGTRNTYYGTYWGPGWGWGWGPGWGWGGYGRFGYGRWGGWGWGGGWGGGYGYPVQEHFKEGVLSIELIDARTRQPIWIGYSSGELSRNPQKAISQLPQVVEGILKRLEVRS